MVAGLGRGDIRVIAVSGTIVAVAGALHFGGASAKCSTPAPATIAAET